MSVKHLFHSKKGVVIEWAIVFGFVVFGLIAVLMTGMFSFHSSISSSNSRSQMRFDLDQIGEYFIRAISGGGDFPTGAEDTAEKFNNKDGFLWMDDDAIAFFLEANKLYDYKVSTFTTNMTGIEGFLSFYTETGCAAKLEVTKKATGEEVLAIIIEEDYDYDVSGMLAKNPILFRDMDGTGTVYQVVEWTVNDTVNPSGTKLSGLQKIWSWIGGAFGNRGEATPNVWSITYSLDGGSGSGYVTCPKGNSVTLSTPKKSGYRFLGWHDATGTLVGAAGASYTPVRSVRLYAKWQINTVTFDAKTNGGQCSVASKQGAIEQLPEATISDPLMVFDGWYTEKTGGKRVGGTGDSYKPTGDVTLYAHWVPYQMTFDANGGQVVPASTAFSSSLTLPTPTRKGYHFDGWYTAASYGSKVTDSLVPTGDVKLYAHWTKITFSIEFDINGGKTADKDFSTMSGLTVDSTKSLETNKYQSWGTKYHVERDGYIFNGWNTQADARA